MIRFEEKFYLKFCFTKHTVKQKTILFEKIFFELMFQQLSFFFKLYTNQWFSLTNFWKVETWEIQVERSHFMFKQRKCKLVNLFTLIF